MSVSDQEAPRTVDRAEAGTAAWEADVVLRDGRPVRLRAVEPGDREALRALHGRLSPETVYLRYFAPHPELSDQDLDRLTNVDHRERVALVAISQGDIIGVGRYEGLGDGRAEVAFVVEDAHQGRGLGSLLLEHLSAVGRENGIESFIAEVLPQNGRMLSTFADAGYRVEREYDEGVVSLSFDLTVTEGLLRVMQSREHRSEARSIARLLAPATVAVVGASRQPGSVGHELLRHLVAGGFTGRILAINPEAEYVLGVTCYPSLAAVGEAVDLALVAVPGESLLDVVQDGAQAGVRGLIIVSEPAPGGAAEKRSVVAAAREAGIRIIGPAALGVVNTAPEVAMNASLAPDVPLRDSIGFFCQSGALGIDILARLRRRGLGVSAFVSAGNRADVSGNDLLQFWEDDPDTSVILLYLESLGNVGKFLRVAARIGQAKPVVALRTTGAMSVHPLGHDVPVTELGERARQQLFEDSGVIDATSLDEMLDIAEVLRMRGLPAGSRLALVGNDSAVATLSVNAASARGLDVTLTRLTGRTASADQYRRMLDDASRDESVDSILAFYVPPIESEEDVRVRDVLATVSAAIEKPTVAVVVGIAARALREVVAVGAIDALGNSVATRAGYGPDRALPIFTDVEHAVNALAKVARHARWRSAQSDETREFAALDETGRAQWPAHAGEEVAGRDALGLLSAAGLPTRADGVAAAARCALVATVDPSVGPVVHWGLDDDVSRLLDARAYAVAPLGQAQGRRLVGRLETASILAESCGGRIPDAVGQLLVALGDLLLDAPSPARVECCPVYVNGEGAWIGDARIVGLPASAGDSWQARQLSR